MPRPKGSKNVQRAEFDRKLDRLQRRHQCDLVELLMGIASGADTSEDWTKENRLEAAKVLLNKRYANKRESGPQEVTGIPDQIQIVYDDSNRPEPVRAPISAVGTKG